VQISEKRWTTLCAFVVMLADALLLSWSFELAYRLRLLLPLFQDDRVLALGSGFHDLKPLFVGTWIFCISVFGLYNIRRRWDFMDVFFPCLLANGAGLTIILVSSYLSRGFYFPRLMIPILWVLSCVFVFISRFVLKRLLRSAYQRGVGTERVLLLGGGPAAEMFVRRIFGRPEMGYELVGLVPLSKEFNKGDEDVRILDCDESGILETATTVNASVVVFAGQISSIGTFPELVEGLQEAGIQVRIIPDLYDIFPRCLTYSEVGDIPMVYFRTLPFEWWDRILKRAMDLLGSAFGLVVLSPFLFAIAWAIKRESPGGALFKQERAGVNGRPFIMYKFRSMQSSAGQAPPTKVHKRDPRVTRVGGFLRRRSLDEMPQLINVLKGDMSLVGPRPETRLYVEQYDRWHRRRLMVKPGMTGLAQAMGIRGNTSIDEKTRLDLEYIETQSLLVDAKILLRTLFTAWSHPEAY